MVRVKIRPEWKRELPVVALLSTYSDWKVEMSADPDPVFTFTLRFRVLRGENDTLYPSTMDKTEVGAHEVRKALFAIKTPEQALALFHRFGPWEVDFAPQQHRLEQWGRAANPISFSQLIEQRKHWQEALVYKNQSDKLSFSAEFRETYWIASCKDVSACVRTTVILDRATRWRWCARKDCTAPPFECGTHGKEYHDDACAALQRMRNLRKKPGKRRSQKQEKE